MTTRRRALTSGASLLGLLCVSLVAVIAQEATPGAPAAVACTVEPRTEEEFEALSARPTPTHVPQDPGSDYDPDLADRDHFYEGVAVVGPADEETVRVVTDAIHQLVACGGAGRSNRWLALVTDDFIVRRGLADDDVGEQEEGGDRVETVVFGVSPVLRLTNGQVVAVVTVNAPALSRPVVSVTYYLEEVNGRWLLDDAF